MRRLLAPSQFKYREKASVFLTELHPAKNVTERAELMALLRKRDFDATHHCVAWREGLPVRAWGADDDGEPAGTAGAPMLRVLEGAELTNVIAVCIRWFGGTKLGTGGLVKAYTACLQGAIEVAEQSGLLETFQLLQRGMIRTSLGDAHLPYHVLGAFGEAMIEGQTFEGAKATLTFKLPPAQRDHVEKAWREKSRGGQVVWQPLGEDE